MSETSLQKKLNFVALVPARSGSKGLSGKNIKELDGLPLIAHSIKPALECKRISEVFVNSDSKEYLSIGEKYGAKSYLRKKENAGDGASLRDVMVEFCSFIKHEMQEINAIIVLYPTYPFRSSDDLNNILDAYEKLEEGRSLIGLLEPKTHPYLIYNREDSGEIRQWSKYDPIKFYRRQDYPVAYELSHWACVVPVDGVYGFDSQMINENTFGYFIKKKRIVDIDTIEDFKYAEYLCK